MHSVPSPPAGRRPAPPRSTVPPLQRTFVDEIAGRAARRLQGACQVGAARRLRHLLLDGRVAGQCRQPGRRVRQGLATQEAAGGKSFGGEGQRRARARSKQGRPGSTVCRTVWPAAQPTPLPLTCTSWFTRLSSVASVPGRKGRMPLPASSAAVVFAPAVWL